MVKTRSQGSQDGKSTPEGELQPDIHLPIRKEIQLEKRNHVFEILNLTTEAIEDEPTEHHQHLENSLHQEEYLLWADFCSQGTMDVHRQ